MQLMRTHFEGTWFDNEGIITDDVGAQSGNSPYISAGGAPDNQRMFNMAIIGTNVFLGAL